MSETSKILYKCGSCSAIACSKCALEGDSITGKRCPFCKTDYTIYSKIEPSAENVSIGNDVSQHQAEILPESDEVENVFLMKKWQKHGDLSHATKGKAIILWLVGVFGFLQIHNFYLGKKKLAILRLMIQAVLVIVAFIVIYLTKDIPYPREGITGYLIATPVFALLGMAAWSWMDIEKVFGIDKSKFGGYK